VTAPATAASRARLPSAGGGPLSALLPILAALAVGALVLAAIGENPAEIYWQMAREAFGGERRIAATLSAATPLLFTGLATAIAFRTGVFNVGVEGGVYAGGMAAAWVGFALAGLPAAVLLPLALAAGAAAGAALLIGPGLMRAYWRVDEVVTTLMINFVAVGVTAWLVNGPLLAPGLANSATPLIAEAAQLPRLLPPSTVHAGLILALALLAGYWLWAGRSVLGYESRMIGINPRFGLAAGIPVERVVVKVMLLSGLIAGLAGACHALGVVHRFVGGFSPGYGFAGIAVALLGRNHAAGILAAALLFGAIASAGTTIQLFRDIPLDIVHILQGTVMIFAVARLRGGR
jgi:simple sugar transport system permease protein